MEMAQERDLPLSVADLKTNECGFTAKEEE
jgi:hypothetical protein